MVQKPQTVQGLGPHRPGNLTAWQQFWLQQDTVTFLPCRAVQGLSHVLKPPQLLSKGFKIFCANFKAYKEPLEPLAKSASSLLIKWFCFSLE